MAEFIEVPIEREDGTEGLHCVNIDAISYVDIQDARKGEKGVSVVVHLSDGYWFTLAGLKADEMMRLLKFRMCVQFKTDPGGN